jgi:hypothetical protein
MARGATDESVTRRGVRLLWASVRAQARPFTVSVAGATLFAVMAVGGTVVLGRVTDDILTPAFQPGPDGGVGRGTIATGRWPSAACRCTGSGG